MNRSSLGRNRWAIGLAGVVLLAAALAIRPAAAAEKVKIASAVSWPAYAFWEIVKTQNLAPDLDLEVTVLNDPMGGYAMLSTGQFQVYGSTIDYAPIATEQGLPIRQVTLGTISNGVDQVMLAPGIKPEGLSGKRVAAPEAFVGHLLVGYWLRQKGIPISDVEWVNLNADEAAGALLGGDIAAAYMYEPWTSKVMEGLPGAVVIAKSDQPDIQQTAMIGDAIYMSESFLAEHRDTALKVLRAYFDAVQWWKDHPAEGNEIISKHLEWPVTDTEFVWGKDGSAMDVEGVYPYTFAQAATACGVSDGEMPFGLVKGQIFKAYELAAENWKELGLVKSPAPVEKGIDCSLMEELVASGYTGKP
jgi:NitT/TauT family transport system substrate-binding protein